ncbi:hypothetical protein [Amycolatopsis sp. cg9]
MKESFMTSGAVNDSFMTCGPGFRAGVVSGLAVVRPGGRGVTA